MKTALLAILVVMTLVSIVGAQSTVAPPVPSPNGGSFSGPVIITLTSATPGAEIRFSSDGSVPTRTSALYDGPFRFSSTKLLRAIAFKDGKSSPETIVQFNVGGASTASAPSFNPAPGRFSSSQSVRIYSGTRGAKIFYTTDGSLPTLMSRVYSQPLALASNTEIKALAYLLGRNPSKISSALYTFSGSSGPARPAIEPFGGRFSSPVTVTIRSSDPVKYTTDGVIPNRYSPSYTGPFTVRSNTTVRAVSYRSGILSSQTIAVFVIDGSGTVTPPAPATPVIEPSGGSFTDSVTVTIRSPETVRYTTDGRTPSSASPLYSGPFTLRSTATVKAVAYRSGVASSQAVASFVITEGYAPTASDTVKMTPSGGSSSSAQQVTITGPSGHELYFTTDGSEPTAASQPYIHPFWITSSRTVKAASIKGGQKTGSASASFTIDADYYYVSPSGSDSNSCTGGTSKPKKTIASAVSCVGSDGSDKVIRIRGGTYSTGLGSSLPSGSSWSHPFTIEAYPGETVILRPSSGDRVLTLSSSSNKYIVVDGFIMDGANVKYDAVKFQGSAHHIRLQNSEIKNAPTGMGILTSGTAGNNEFINLDIHDNGVDHLDHGIYIKTQDNMIESCRIHDNSGYGVHIYDEYDNAGKVSGNIVRNNRVYDNANSKGGAGILLGSGPNNIAYNNIIWGNKPGIKIGYYGATNNQAYNNVIYGNTGGIVILSGFTGIVKNNIIVNSGTAISGSATQSNNLLSDPGFANPSAHDFRLREGSQAINAGTRIEAVTVDLGGAQRPQGSAYDIGAYEAG